MSVTFRHACREDVAAIVDLLRDDTLGMSREIGDLAEYTEAFDAMKADRNNLTIVGEAEGKVVATYQLTVIQGLSLRAARRAQIESVRVAADRRRSGIGRAMFEDASQRAQELGCSLMQLTMSKSRTESARFYEALGFVSSHVGFKLKLN